MIYDENYRFPKNMRDWYYGKEAYEAYGDLVAQNLKGKTVSKRSDHLYQSGGLRYEADQLGIDMYDLLACLEGMCHNRRAIEIDDSTYKILGSTRITASKNIQTTLSLGEMENLLDIKLQDENTSCSCRITKIQPQDIDFSVKTCESYKIQILDYYKNPYTEFHMSILTFKKEKGTVAVMVVDDHMEEIIFNDWVGEYGYSSLDYLIKDALIKTGYYFVTRY